MSQQADVMQALVQAARAAELEVELLVECVQRRLVAPRATPWDDEAIEQARRVRRLRALGVNLQGIEVIFHMRRRAIQMQQEMERLHAQMEQMRREHESELARLLREVAREG